MSNDVDKKLRTFLDAEREAQVRFLAALVKIPTDNPPGDCAVPLAGDRRPR